MSVNSRRQIILKFVQKLSHLLDQAFKIPGTSLKIGLDPLLGLIPGIGDFIGFMLSSLIILAALLIPVSPWTLLHMVVNITLESVIGIIPIIGDTLDFVWKANIKNRQLLENDLRYKNQNTKSKIFVLTALSLTITALLGLTYALYIMSVNLYAFFLGLF